MRTITRTGVTLSIVAALALYGVQLVAALVVAGGIVLVGALAGLCVAKWLERDWYGRQLDAGARAGAIACGVGGVSALFYLLGQGPHSVADLAARSHLLGLDLGPVITPLSSLDWTGIDILMISAAVIAGILMSAIVAQLAGWSKSGRAVRVITQARQAAQALQRADGRGAAATLRPATSGPQLYATGAPLPAPVHESAEWDGLGLPGASAPKAAKPRSWRSAAPAVSPVASQTATPRPANVHRPSDARSAKESLTDEARLALSSWEDELDAFDSDPALPDFSALESDEGDTITETVRKPNPSTFLTSPPPVNPGKRKRKRQNTGDWLC
jgi:hypothetical protein